MSREEDLRRALVAHFGLSRAAQISAEIDIAAGRAPGYWRHEQAGILRPVIEAYLAGGPMSDQQIGYMRKYLKQWADATGWEATPEIDHLRLTVGMLQTREQIEQWISEAVSAGCDPL